MGDRLPCHSSFTNQFASLIGSMGAVAYAQYLWHGPTPSSGQPQQQLISVTNCLVRGPRMRAKATSLVATGHILLCQSVSWCRRRWSMQNENSLKIYNWLTRTMFKWAGISCAECRNFDSSRSFRSAVARAKWCTQTHRVSNGIWSPFNWSNLC